jgi:hypothetical protein
MAKVTKMSNGYDFAGLCTVGKRIVNEFQRHHPLLCKPSPQPSHRFVYLGSPEQNLLVERLVADVLALDPEPKPALWPKQKATK